MTRAGFLYLRHEGQFTTGRFLWRASISTPLSALVTARKDIEEELANADHWAMDVTADSQTT